MGFPGKFVVQDEAKEFCFFDEGNISTADDEDGIGKTMVCSE